MVSAQQPVRTSISGVVVDAETGETLPFVQIYYLKSTTSQGMVPSGKGTTSDMDGNFRISSSEGYTTLTFQMLGYKTEMVTLRKGQTRTNAKIKLKPDVYGLQDIVVTPKNRKRLYGVMSRHGDRDKKEKLRKKFIFMDLKVKKSKN